MEPMTVEKNGYLYTVTERKNVWVVKLGKGRISVQLEVPKEICKDEKAIREYILTENRF